METAQGLEVLFRKMMGDFAVSSQDDEVFRRDIEELGTFKIQWRICGMQGYQILDRDHYTFEFGKNLSDPDITFTLADEDVAARFLRGESFPEFASTRKKEKRGEFLFRYTEEWQKADEPTGTDKKRVRKDVMHASFDPAREYHPYMLEKLPMFRGITGISRLIPVDDDGDFGAYIPINQSLGTFENEMLPMKVFAHFFEKASNIVLLNTCGCRVFCDCQDHDHNIGCMHLGDDTLKLLLPPERGRVITKEEAMATLQRAVEGGLIPLLGRAKGEARGMGVKDSGHFMSMCFCCSCCCVNAKFITHGSMGNKLNYMFHRMEGVTVEIDEEACTGCEDCLDVCVFNGLKMADGVARINQDRCLGCGRCESECPVEAISITIDDDSRVHELIRTLESYVDITPQKETSEA